MKVINPSDFSFEKLIKSDALYVDKTEYIWKLVGSNISSYFLSRPRRFGKSLTVSTLEAFFHGKKELFKGLAIEKLAPADMWQEWPIIHLDMADMSSQESKENLISNMAFGLKITAKRLGVELTATHPTHCLKELIYSLNEKTGKQVVILIDEYDKPILDSLHKEYVNQVVGFMGEFYQQLKSANSIIRFVFVTGVSKFAHTSLFSGANNMVDLTQDAKFATMLGYTEKELKDNFSEYIQEGTRRLNIPESELLESMKYWYDGFRFTPNAESVYNPVSIGRFFSNYEFNNYWCETGNPRFLIEQVKSRPILFTEVSTEWKPANVFSKFDVTHINPVDLALQTGYLTIKDSREDAPGVYSVRYDFPNNEIRETWNRDILTLMLGGDEVFVGTELYKLRSLLREADVEGFMDCLQNFMGGIPFENTKSKNPEGVYRNYLHVIFSLVNLPFQAEVQQASGKVDLVAVTREATFAFEIKLVDDDKKKDKALEDALEQAREKKYAEPYLNKSAVVKRIGIVFNSKTRQLVDWTEEDAKK